MTGGTSAKSNAGCRWPRCRAGSATGWRAAARPRCCSPGQAALLVSAASRAIAHTYQFFGINTAGTGRIRERRSGQRGVNVEESITINRPVELLYRFWRNLENLPRVMRHLESVERVTDTLSRWRAKGPAERHRRMERRNHQRDAQTVIAWQSLEGSDVVSAGSVNFDAADAGAGTRVRVRLQYNPPGGKVGAALVKLLGRDAATEIRQDLRQFKETVEGQRTANRE